MAESDVGEAERSLKAAGFNTSVRPASDALLAIRNSDQKLLVSKLGTLGIPMGSPLGQALMRLCTP